MKTLKERFEEKFIPEPNTGCWLWTAFTNKDGYGTFGFNKKVERAHRVSYIIHFGEIPKGLCVCHKCDTTACVNPDHLFLGTVSINQKDSSNKKRHHEARKTHCIHGHPFSIENTYLNNGWRFCRSCGRDKARIWREKKAATLSQL